MGGGGYKGSGPDKLDAIEILASTTKIQAVSNLHKMFSFSSPGKRKKMYFKESIY